MVKSFSDYYVIVHAENERFIDTEILIRISPYRDKLGSDTVSIYI